MLFEFIFINQVCDKVVPGRELFYLLLSLCLSVLLSASKFILQLIEKKHCESIILINEKLKINTNEKYSRMFQQSEVLLCRVFQGLLMCSLDSWLVGGLTQHAGLYASCCVLLLFSSFYGCTGPESKEAAQKENSLISL